MKLDKLLEYQEIDINLRRQLDIIERSEDAKKIEQAKNEFATAKKAVEDSDKAAGSLLEFFTSCQKYYEEADKKISELDALIQNGGSDADADAIMRDLEKLRSRIAELEAKLNDRKAKSENVIKTYASASERGRKIRDFHAKAKERQDLLKSKIEPEVTRLKNKLAEIEPDIDPEIMVQYKNLTAERKYPAFVEVYADDKTYSCRGCGIALSQTGSSTIDTKGYCVCESCRRIVYKRQGK